MKQTLPYRHGEIALRKINKLPKELTPANTNVFMRGSHGHDHSFDNGTLYLKQVDDFVFGYLEAKDTSLLHPEHSPKVGDAKIEDGIYELRKQQEHTAAGLVPVID